MSLLLYFTPFPIVSIDDFEQVNDCWLIRWEDSRICRIKSHLSINVIFAKALKPKKVCLLELKMERASILTLSWRRPLSYRNQSINLRSKSMNWFLYDNGLRHERVKEDSVEPFRLIYRDFEYLKHDLLIAKLANYGFESQALNSVFSSYTKRSHRNKIKNPCSNFLKVIFDFLQYSILFNIQHLTVQPFYLWHILGDIWCWYC